MRGHAKVILHISHTSWLYFGLNWHDEDGKRQLGYYTLLNIHHLGVLNEYPDMANRTMPLYHDYVQTPDLVRERLTSGTRLPSMWVIRAVLRGGITIPPVATSLPAVAPQPAVEERILLIDRHAAISK